MNSRSDTIATEMNQSNNDKAPKVECILLEGYSGNSFGEKLTFTVGLSFLSFGFFGFFKGIYDGYIPNNNLPRRLVLNNFTNSV